MVMRDELDFSLDSMGPVPWADFLLNPRKLRGSDFLMRWSQGAWSESQLVAATNVTQEFFALPYGPSGVAPTHEVRAYELYFERLEHAGLGDVKRPDLLIFRADDRTAVETIVRGIGGLEELPFTRENDPQMSALIAKSIVAIECENSLWRASQMPGYHTPLKPQKRLQGKLGLPKATVTPTVIIKEEDRPRLKNWEQAAQKPIHVWHAFYDLAIGLPLSRADELISEGLIQPTVQKFQAPNGASDSKIIYKFYHHYAYPLATAVSDPRLVADSITDKNGHILPYVRFEGGERKLTAEALAVLRTLGSV